MRKLLALVLLAIIIPGAAYSQQSGSENGSLTQDQARDVANIAAKTLLSPDLVMVAIVESYRRKEEEARARIMVQAELATAEANAGLVPARGSSDAIPLIVFDAPGNTCEQCRALDGALGALIKDVRLIHKVVDGSSSNNTGARALAAAFRIGGYDGWNNAKASIASVKDFDDGALQLIAKSLEVDLDRLRVEMSAPVTSVYVQRDLAAAVSAGVPALPMVILGDAVLVQPSPADLQQAFEKLRTRTRQN